MKTLDVALGLVFVYLMLSLVCTAANELLAQWFNSRATTLKQGIDALLRNVTEPVTTATQEQLEREAALADIALGSLESQMQGAAGSAYTQWAGATLAADQAQLVHEQVCARVRTAERGSERGNDGAGATGIPELDAMRPETAIGASAVLLRDAIGARALAAQALDAALPGATTQLEKARRAAACARANAKLATFYEHPLIAGLSQLPWRLMPWGDKVRLPSYIPTQTFTLTLIDIIAPSATGSPTPLLEVRRALASFPEHVRRPLLLALNEAAGDLDAFRASLSVWYDNTMERVSGLYKRKTKLTVLMFAVAVTLFTNADTVRIVRALSTNDQLRQAVVAQAEAAARDGGVRDSSVRAIAELQTLGIPIGYDVPNGFADRVAKSSWFGTQGRESRIALYLEAYVPQLLRGWVGLLLTTLALSLGAPFWFDILNKIVNVRAVGRTPAENAKAKK